MKKANGSHCAEATAKVFFRTVSVPEHEILAYGGVDAMGDILKHPSALKEAYDAGKRLGELNESASGGVDTLQRLQ